MVGKEFSSAMGLIDRKLRRSGSQNAGVRAHLTQMMDHLLAE